MNIDEIIITSHAIERFKKRYEELNNVQLNDAELTDRLRNLIDEAVPEEETPILKLRREAHNGIGTYLINHRWRFVFSGETLETCEIVPQDMLLVENQHIPINLEKTRFIIKIKADRQRLLTEITRSFDGRELHLQSFIEIDVIIRALRILGLEVNQLTEPNKLEIVIPQNIDAYHIEQSAKPENLLISLGRTDSFPLGLQRFNCLGIFKLDLERILNFLQINKSQ